ncbi:MAG: ligase-associated DNA damage response exonuclease [Pseudomonadota bacterium]
MTAPPVSSWLYPRAHGLYCAPLDAFIDPARPVDRALITHGHADHARPGHGRVLATADTLAIMQRRYGADCFRSSQAAGIGETITVDDVRIRFAPAGHVLGSAQIVIEHAGRSAVVSGDYKRQADRTCAAFEPIVGPDVFITEATFGLPVFSHPPIAGEVAKLLAARSANPDRAILLGVYALGKAQRMIAALRDAGYDRPLHLHGALVNLCDFYEQSGVALGERRPATGGKRGDLAGEIVLAPGSAMADRWSRRLPDPIVAPASGWMRVRQRAKQRGAELPLIVSDHVDWAGLTGTIEEVAPGEVWITHGREEALAHWCRSRGIAARALALVGREDESE